MTSVLNLIKERFSDLTEIQKLAIPKILNGENTLILAPTGFGKTEAAILPILERIKEGTRTGICALYITPLRALNRDLLKRFSWWCERLEVSYGVRHGDSTEAERVKQRKRPPQILIITCETLQALFLGKIMRQHLSNVEYIIADEVHELLDNKRGTQLSLGLERLEQITKKKFQRIGLTATVGDEEEAAKLIFGFREYSVAETGKNRKLSLEIDHLEKQEKRINKIKMLSETHRTLVFVNTRSTAEELGANLKKLGAPIDLHHGSLSKDVRITAEDNFKSGEIKSLIATSSLELGIDIGDVDLVIQHSSPHQVSRLIQRVGRSGHALDKTPHGIIFPTDFDDMLESEVITLLAKNGWMEKKVVEKGALDVIAHQLIGLCFDNGGITLKQSHEILSKSYAYGISFQKLRRIALQLHSEGLIYYDERTDDVTDANIKNRTAAREYYYSNLTTIPKEKRYLLREVSSNKVIANLDEKFVLNLENNASFLSKGQPWMVIDITDEEVLAEPSSALDIVIPSWAGEEIPVEFEVAKRVGQLRKAYKKSEILADEKKIVLEIIGDLVIIHACFGNKINEGIGRILSYNLSKLIGESVRVVADPYRVLVKLPFPLGEEHLLKALIDIKSARAKLMLSLENSFLLKLKFTHVARLFGLFDEKATATARFIELLRNSVVYEETIRSIFFKYFDVDMLEEIAHKIENKEIEIVIDKRKEPSFFGKLGIERTGGGEAIGEFEPKEAMINALKERILTTTFDMKCLSCRATRFMNLAGIKDEDRIKCHKCGEQALTIIEKHKKLDRGPEEQVAALIRNYGRRALIALATYGIGPGTAGRILRKLHGDESTFYLDLLEAQKNFVKNKKYWKFD